MSGVRKHFCAVVGSGGGGGSRPRKNGICGCIPAVVSSVERSSARGTSDADGRRRWPFRSKNDRNPSRISAVECTAGIVGSRCCTFARRGGPRRRRYRYRLRRLAVVVPIVLAAAIAGAWIGTHRPQAATISSPAREAMVGVDRTPVRSVPPPRLLFDDRAVTHTFSPGLTAAVAIVADTGTGRVIWSLRPHQHRRIASLTKIMTALLALRALGPHDLVTVDKTVPRVPLVREGLRAGERVQAWKLFYSMLLYSGNDDALALAIAAGGDKWTFVQEMNDEARRLGLH